MKKQPRLAASAAVFPFFSSLQVASGRLVKKKKKKKVGLPTPFSLQPRRRGSLPSSLFLAPLGCVSPFSFFLPPFHPCQQKLRRPHSPVGSLLWRLQSATNAWWSQVGGGCHRSQGSQHSVHWLSSDLSGTCSSCLLHEKLF